MSEMRLQQAIAHHQAGRFQQAELGYKEVLERNPQNPDALHLLGVLAHQHGKNEIAAQLIEQAKQFDSCSATIYCNLTEVYRALGRTNEAIAAGQMAIQLQPDYAEALCNLALALMGKEEHERAESHLREAVRLKPDFSLAHGNLGNALREQGKFTEALEAYREAVRVAPDSGKAHSNLGQMLLQTGEIDEALEHCRQAVHLEPNLAEAHSNFANVLREMGDLKRAAAHYETARQLNPELAMVISNIGQLHHEKGEFIEAVDFYQQALTKEPETLRFHLNLAGALVELQRMEEAIARYKIAHGIAPDNAAVLNGLAHAYVENEDNDQAIEAYQRALEIDPELAIAHAGLGHLYEQLGQGEQAEACFRAALAHNKKAAGAYVGLATHNRQKLSDSDIAAMREMLDQPYVPDGQSAALHFGLAHILDADGDYKAAAEHMRNGNAHQKKILEKRGQSYDPAAHETFVDQLLEVFERNYFRRAGFECDDPSQDARPIGLNTDVPVFVVGLPRSGTTLTEQIIASHSQAFGAGELPLAGRALESIPARADLDLSGPSAVGELSAMGARFEKVVLESATEHLEQLRRFDANASRIVDKMPENTLNLGWIATMFPRAKIIHCRRDVRDTALSCWLTNFKSIRWASDIDHIATRIEQYQRVMDHWREVLPLPMLEIDYEDTVANFEDVARRLIDWLGLEWEPACLEFHQTKRAVRTASLSQVRQPIYTRSAGRWKNYESELGVLFNRIAPTHEPVKG